MSASHPVSRLVIYRPIAGHYAALEALVKKHGPVLRQSGLLTDQPVRLYKATDLKRDGGEIEPYVIETFEWRDGAASDLAHQMPEVMAVWETMGPHIEGMTLTTLENIAT